MNSNKKQIIYRGFSFVFAKRNIVVGLYVLLYALMAIPLVVRDIPISSDDQQYLDNFSFLKLSEMDISLLSILVEEPLWRAYCELLSIVASPEMSIRITIFISVAILGLVPLILGARGLVFYWMWFALHPHLAPEIAFNQIRQGLGLAIFMGMFSLTKRIIVPAFVGGLFHTSVASLGILAISRRHVIAISVVVALGLLFATTADELEFLLGRRIYHLDEPIALTLNYYLVNVAIVLFFGFILYGHQNHQRNSLIFPVLFWGWFYLSLSVLVISLFLYFGPRLDYFSAYLLGLLLTISNVRKDSGIFYGKAFALLYVLLLNIRLEFEGAANSPIRNWGLILGL